MTVLQMLEAFIIHMFQNVVYIRRPNRRYAGVTIGFGVLYDSKRRPFWMLLPQVCERSRSFLPASPCKVQARPVMAPSSPALSSLIVRCKAGEDAAAAHCLIDGNCAARFTQDTINARQVFSLIRFEPFRVGKKKIFRRKPKQSRHDVFDEQIDIVGRVTFMWCRLKTAFPRFLMRW